MPHQWALSINHDALVVISGMGGHRADGTISDNAEEQTREALSSIQDALKTNQSDLQEIVHVRVFMSAREDIPAIDAVLAEVLPDPKPAAGAYSIVGLAESRMKVEIEVVAVRGASLEATSLDN